MAEENGCFIENRGYDVRSSIPDIAGSAFISLIPYLLEDKSHPKFIESVSIEEFVISRRVMTLGKYLTPSHLL